MGLLVDLSWRFSSDFGTSRFLLCVRVSVHYSMLDEDIHVRHKHFWRAVQVRHCHPYTHDNCHTSSLFAVWTDSHCVMQPIYVSRSTVAVDTVRSNCWPCLWTLTVESAIIVIVCCTRRLHRPLSNINVGWHQMTASEFTSEAGQDFIWHTLLHSELSFDFCFVT